MAIAKNKAQKKMVKSRFMMIWLGEGMKKRENI